VNRNARVASSQDGARRTNLAVFLRGLLDARADQLRAQRVTHAIEVSGTATFELPLGIVRRVLETWIDESLSVMSDGGELHLTAVVTGQAIEIEVADSRDVGGHGVRDVWRREDLLQEGAVIDAHLAMPLRVEAQLCPQGGLARTLVIPDPRHARATRQAGWRKKVA
jgi:hypothetical protein